METVLKYWPLILFGLNVVALWGSWSVTRGIPSHANVQAVAASVIALKTNIEGRMTEQDKTIARLDEAVKHAPTHTDIKELSKRIEELHGDLKEVVGSLTGIRRAVDLMNEYLLNKGER